MKDLGIGLLGMSEDEFYAMTLGNFTRRSLGWIKNTWITQRELIAAVVSQWSKEPVKGEDVFSFGQARRPDPPTDDDREYMRKRHENTLKLIHG